MTKHLLRDLEQLSSELLQLTRKVEDQLSAALACVMTRDAENANKVIQTDDEIDRMEVKLEEDALKILALHQPVASDLRFIIAAIKINNDVERIADLAANIAKRAVELSHMAPVAPPDSFEEMAEKARLMVRQAITALIRRDAVLAKQVTREDDTVDQLNRQIARHLRERMKDCAPDHIDPLMRWLSAVRHLERVADMSVNIAEDVIYMVEGDIVRHTRSSGSPG
ncbi:MAG: phosphate signaling complex protein PhoU [Planctomycetota bacterium]|nr:MAG: phosphate signaling complex protein PhoU [Planctomycetota bacterium]